MGIHVPTVGTGFSPDLPRILTISLALAGSLFSGLIVRAADVQDQNARTAAALQKHPWDPEGLPPTLEDLAQRKREAARAALIQQMRAKALAEVEAAARPVPSPDLAALARALRVELEAPSDADPDVAASAFKVLDDLDDDGYPEAAFRWSRPERLKLAPNDDIGALPAWVIFLFSWDGTRWRVSELMTGNGLCGLDTISGFWPTPAVVAVEGLSSAPYPVIFRVQNHAAAVAWDSRDENSRYQAYARGTVHFDERDDGPPPMIVTGRADPGVLRFSPDARRGFDVATAYLWEDGAYVPKKTEFEENEDYTLYRFIAALHLRDFRTAYSLIDPARFLKGGDLSVEAFRKNVEENWPEFTGNSIFEAIDQEVGQNRFAFELRRGSQHFIYFPEFSNDRSLLLTGLERRERKPHRIED